MTAVPPEFFASSERSPERPFQGCADCLLGGRGEDCPLRRQTVADGATLLPSGEVPQQLIHLKSAVVELISTTMAGVERRYSLRGPGAVLGWQGLRGLPSCSEVRVLHGGEICTLPVDRVHTGDVKLVAALLEPLTDELAQTGCELHLSKQPAATRVARFLLSEIVCVSQTLDGRTARSVARQLGIRHETLSRVLKKLEANGIIARSPLRVLDREGLQRVVRTGVA